MNKQTKNRIVASLLLALGVLPIFTSAQLADSSKRLVKMEKAANFRDIGGYETETGKKVKWGRIYRSAAISQLSSEDLEKFRKKHITQVFDFRGEAESAAAPDKLPEGVVYTLCSAGSNKIGKDAMPDFTNLEKLPAFLTAFYGQVDSLAIRYKPLFQALLTMNEKQAVLYHCTGGRDRTGIATALILNVLQVPQHQIEADYLASNYYLKQANKAMFSKMGKLTDQQVELISKALELKPVYLQTTFSALEKKYGSLDNFYEKGLGIGEKEKLLLREKYTE
ncbi:tyrosine-protein phosphatase [Olivibacter jilunii]|uniref:tyrosine-protein phosphatase n=1 Tax=Olivibacter jilunii TaxID=985016 RepID=UPI003F1711A4